MGCICSGESDIENFFIEFVKELKINKYNEKTFFAFLDKNSPYQSLKSNYDEFLKSNQNEEIHNNYKNLLLQRKKHLFYASLVFLIESDPINLSTNYRKILEVLKNSHTEFKSEFLEDFFKNDYEILFHILNFYVRMISLDIIEAMEKTNDNRMTEDQRKFLLKCYDVIVIEVFVRNMMKDFRNGNNDSAFDLEDFFNKNHKNLNHIIIRDKLKKIYENFDLYSNKENDNKLASPNLSKWNIDQETTLHQNLELHEEIVECEANEDIDNERQRLKLEQYNMYRKGCLFHHNRIRAFHGVPPLIESDSLSEYSQQWAEYIAETDKLTHSSMSWEGRIIGENIAKAGAIINEPSELIVSKWYEERENYDFENHLSKNSTKNFTQMVWKETEAIGFGLAFSETGNTFIVINYFPAGNISSGYKDNVLPVGY
jgi:hypothetical protein